MYHVNRHLVTTLADLMTSINESIFLLTIIPYMMLYTLYVSRSLHNIISFVTSSLLFTPNQRQFQQFITEIPRKRNLKKSQGQPLGESCQLSSTHSKIHTNYVNWCCSFLL